MVEPTVSVIIPAYNAQRFLKQTLDSVIGQRFEDVEIIVVDDGSTDETASIARSYAGVHYHFQANRGPAAARNAGLGLSRGEYVAFLDADDLWHEDMLKACVDILSSRPSISAVHTNWLPIDAEGQIIQEKSYWQPWRGDIFERLLLAIPLINGAILWRRRCFDDIGGFDETPELNDDWLNWLRIAHLGHQFECLERPLAYYRWHDRNLTRRQSYRVIEWRKNALDVLFAEIEVDAHLQRQAYAQVHWVKSMAALALSDIDEAANQFSQAVALDGQLLQRAETYYAIAHQGGEVSSLARLDFQRAELNLARFLAELEESTPEGIDERIKKAWGEGYFYLAQMAYGAADDSTPVSRAYLVRAARANPRQFGQRKRMAWALRILAGRSITRFLRGKKSGSKELVT